MEKEWGIFDWITWEEYDALSYFRRVRASLMGRYLPYWKGSTVEFEAGLFWASMPKREPLQDGDEAPYLYFNPRTGEFLDEYPQNTDHLFVIGEWDPGLYNKGADVNCFLESVDIDPKKECLY